MFVRHFVNYSQVFTHIQLKFSVQISISLRKVLNYFAEKSEQRNIFTFLYSIFFFTFSFKSASNHFSKLLISSLYFEAKSRSSKRIFCSSEILSLRSISPSEQKNLLEYQDLVKILPITCPFTRVGRRRQPLRESEQASVIFQAFYLCALDCAYRFY